MSILCFHFSLKIIGFSPVFCEVNWIFSLFSLILKLFRSIYSAQDEDEEQIGCKVRRRNMNNRLERLLGSSPPTPLLSLSHSLSFSLPISLYLTHTHSLTHKEAFVFQSEAILWPSLLHLFSTHLWNRKKLLKRSKKIKPRIRKLVIKCPLFDLIDSQGSFINDVTKF